MAKKIRRKADFEAHGFKIWVGPPKAVKRGKPRIWIIIRQDETKKKEWRVYENLSYAKGVDIAFVKD